MAPNSRPSPTFAHFLIGRSALQRELIYTEVRRALRQVARIGYAPIDIALWDIAGKLYDQSIYKLLGGYKDSIPCYASTYPRRPPARRPLFARSLR